MRLGEVRRCGVVLDYMCMYVKGDCPRNVGGDFLYRQLSVSLFTCIGMKGVHFVLELKGQSGAWEFLYPQ